MKTGRKIKYAIRQTYLEDGSLHLLKKLPSRKVLIKSISKELDKCSVAQVEMSDGKFWADLITGSTYDPITLKCRSGQLEIVKFL